MRFRILFGVSVLATAACTSTPARSSLDDAGLSVLDASSADASNDARPDGGAALGQPCSIEAGGCALGLACGFPVSGGCDAAAACAAERNPPGAPCSSLPYCGCDGKSFQSCEFADDAGYAAKRVAYVGGCLVK